MVIDRFDVKLAYTPYLRFLTACRVMKLRETHSLQFYRALVRRCYYSYRRVLIFRTRTEKRGVGGKLFSLGTRRLSRRIFLLSKGITINFSSLFFFLFNSKRKIFG